MQPQKSKEIHVYTDGGSRGNPGQASIGVYIEENEGHKLASFGKRIGIATNNIAEYKAILAAVSWLLENKEKIIDYDKISFFMDSQLICFQILGKYKVKQEKLAALLFQLLEKLKEIPIGKSFSYIPREKNKKADRLVNLALDNKI